MLVLQRWRLAHGAYEGYALPHAILILRLTHGAYEGYALPHVILWACAHMAVSIDWVS